jgi:hypothetical protein
MRSVECQRVTRSEPSGHDTTRRSGRQVFLVELSLDDAHGRAGLAVVVEVEPGLFRAKGWARDPYEDKSAKEVVVVNQRRHVVAYCRVNVDRVDVAKAQQNDRLLYCGWKAFFHLEDLDEGENQLFAYVLCPKGEDAFELYREANFVVERACPPAAPSDETEDNESIHIIDMRHELQHRAQHACDVARPLHTPAV